MPRWTKLFEFMIPSDGPAPTAAMQTTINAWLKKHEVKAVSMTLFEGKLSIPIDGETPGRYAQGICAVVIYEGKKPVKEDGEKRPKKNKGKKKSESA